MCSLILNVSIKNSTGKFSVCNMGTFHNDRKTFEAQETFESNENTAMLQSHQLSNFCLCMIYCPATQMLESFTALTMNQFTTTNTATGEIISHVVTYDTTQTNLYMVFMKQNALK